MEFDWDEIPFKPDGFETKEIEEAFEDPFNIRILPEDVPSREARYFMLGKSVTGAGLFCVFRTDGKRIRVILARKMTPEEETFYERKNTEIAG